MSAIESVVIFADFVLICFAFDSLKASFIQLMEVSICRINLLDGDFWRTQSSSIYKLPIESVCLNYN